MFGNLFNADTSNQQVQRLDLNRSAARIPKTLSADGHGPIKPSDQVRGRQVYCRQVSANRFAVIDSSQTIRLSSLEVVLGPSDHDIDMCGTLLRIYLSVSRPVETLEFWRNITHHKSTLARFVCHQRIVSLDDDSPHFEEEMDLLDLSLLPKGRAELDRFRVVDIKTNLIKYAFKRFIEPEKSSRRADRCCSGAAIRELGANTSMIESDAPHLLSRTQPSRAYFGATKTVSQKTIGR
jgi:hypothetical protein